MEDGPVCPQYVHGAVLQSLGYVNEAALREQMPLVTEPQLHLAAEIPGVFGVAAEKRENFVELMSMGRG